MITKIENLSQYYYEKLHSSTKPGALLVSFLCEILGRDRKSSDYSKLNKLVRMYGRESVFFAILEVYDMDNPENYYPYMSAILKARLAKKNQLAGYPAMISFEEEVKELDKIAKKIIKEREKDD